jgi:N6-adenosine-specific RNA methylase IME4
MSKKFKVIVADPPYSFNDKLLQSDVARGAASNYGVMSISDIKNLAVKDCIAQDGAILALWVPSSLLQDGLDIMKAWGFTHKQTYVWVKTKKDSFFDFKRWVRKSMLKCKQIAYDKFAYERASNSIIESIKNINLHDTLAFGMGRLFRQTHEICLIGTSNNKIYKDLKNKSQRSVSFGENLKHSAKPSHLQDSLEIMFPNQNYLEIFGRRDRAGWCVIGNESPQTLGEDIKISLAKLI